MARSTLMTYGFKGLMLASTIVWATAAHAQPSQAQPGQYPDYSTALPILQQRTTIPVLLPTDLPGKLYGSLEQATANSYRLYLDFSPDCGGASACTLGRVSGEARSPNVVLPTGKRVQLANGITGYYQPVDFRQCGAGYCFDTLTWEMDGNRYSIQLKLQDQSRLIRIANSAIVAQQPPIVQARPQKITATEARQLQQFFARQAPSKTVVLNHTFRINVSTFGSCLFVPVIDRASRTAKLSLYLVKGDSVNGDRIVYTFPQPTWIQSWSLQTVKAVSFTELNFDGGDGDIVLISEYTANGTGAPSVPVVMVYLTADQGYELDDKISQILTKRKVRTVAQAVSIMRQEFQYLP